jgi:hypothetical protein
MDEPDLKTSISSNRDFPVVNHPFELNKRGIAHADCRLFRPEEANHFQHVIRAELESVSLSDSSRMKFVMYITQDSIGVNSSVHGVLLSLTHRVSVSITSDAVTV